MHFFQEINNKIRNNWNSYLLNQYKNLINSIDSILTDSIKIFDEKWNLKGSYSQTETDTFKTTVGDYINLYLIIDKNQSAKNIMGEIRNKKDFFINLWNEISEKSPSISEICNLLKNENVSFIKNNIIDKKQDFCLKTPKEISFKNMYFFRNKLIEKLLFLIDEDGLIITKKYFWNYEETNLSNQPLVYKNFWNFYKQILIWYKCIIPIIFSVLVESGLVNETDKTYLFEQDPDK